MISLLTILVCLFCVVLSGWTLITYLFKKNSQRLITEEIKNLFDIGTKFFISLNKLIGILMSSESIEANSVESKVLEEEEQTLSVIQQVKEIGIPSLDVGHEEDNDTALSSFSPEVIEVINEEEEKVA